MIASNRVQILLRVIPELSEAITKRATALGLSKNAYVISILVKELKL